MQTLKKITRVVLLGGLLLGLSFNTQAETANIDVFDAAREGDIATLERYAQAGGDLSVANRRGHTPFILATYYGHNEAAAELLALGAEPCAIDEQGSNAFMGVAFKGHLDTAQWLLENTECDVNHRNYAGQTALMMAALFDRVELVELMLTAGANPDVQDLRGNTAESLARGQGLGKMIKILEFNSQARKARARTS